MRIHDAKVLGAEGWIFTQDGMWFSESTRNRNPWRWNDLPRSFPSTHYLKGRTLSIASDWGVNYSHFLLDCLGRYAAFLKAGFSARDIDHIYCTKPPTAAARKLLIDLGIPTEKIVFSDQFPMIQAEELIAPSCPAQQGAPPSWVIDFLRNSLAPGDAGTGGRIYVPRDGSRKLANEAALLPIMQNLGFRIFDHRTDDAARLFAGCDAVVGPHGAGLVNSLFCRPGANLLELTPSDHCFPFYYTLAESAGLEFSYLLGKSLGTRTPGSLISPYDFEVDAKEFEEALQSILTP
jgi:capsular polysaccharide biosynthesis protein